MLWMDITEINNLIGLHNCVFTRGTHGWAEVTGRPTISEVAPTVSLVCTNQGKVTM